MIYRTSPVARVSVPPSRAGPSRSIHLVALMLALSVAAIANAQTVKLQRTDSLVPALPRADSGRTATDSAASTTKEIGRAHV